MDIQAQTTLFRTTVMKLHEEVDKFKLPEGVSESALGALSVFSQQLEGFTYSISQYQISKVAPNVRGDVKAVMSVLDGKFHALEITLKAVRLLAQQAEEEIGKVQEELRNLSKKLGAENPPTLEEKVALEARKNRLEAYCVKKKELINLCDKEDSFLKEVMGRLQNLELTINPNHTDKQSSEVREGKPKWIGVRWNEDRRVVAAITFRDFVLSPLRLVVSQMRMTGTFVRSTWANLTYTVSTPSTFRLVTGFLLVGFCSLATFAIGSAMTVVRGAYRIGVNLVGVAQLPWKAGQSNWVRKVGDQQVHSSFVLQVLKGAWGGIAPNFGHVVTAKGEELTSCIEGEDNWMDDYWTKWDGWVENVVSQLGPPSDELHRQNLSGIR